MSIRSIWQEWPLRILAGLIFVVGVVCMPGETYTGDPIAVREETRAILLHGELAVERVVEEAYRNDEPGQFIVRNPRNGRCYSKYGSMSAWMYLLPLGLELLVEGRLPPFDSYCRLFYLNLFNLLLSLLFAASLYRTARRLGGRPWVAALFVALCFYTTFLWNYLRAQNTEIMQLLFFAWAVTGFLDALDERRAGAEGRGVLRMWAACAALLLTKASYVFVGPLFACGLAVERRHRDGGSWLSAGILEALCHGIPFLAMIAAWAAVNTVKFGQPWLTGYHVWRPSDHSLTGDLRESLPALLGSVQRGFVFCFPVLVIALPFMRRWLRTRPVAYGGIVAVFLVYVGLIGMLPSWTGEWCYGPRYWLFILPFVSMPAVDALEWLRRGGPAALGFAAITVAGLGYSTWLQVQVNRFPFFAYYQLMIPVREFSSPSLDAFFLGQSYGWIEYSMWRNRHALDKLPWWHEIERSDDSTFPLRYERHVRRQLNRGNSFLFPPHAD